MEEIKVILFIIIIFLSCTSPKTNIYESYSRVSYIKENIDLSISHFKELVKNFPQNAEYQRILGICYRENKQYDSALIAMNHSILLAPKYGNAYLGRAMVYLNLNDWESAREDCHLAQKYQCNALGQLYSTLGIIALHRQNYRESIEFVQKSNHYSDAIYCKQNDWILAQNYLSLKDTIKAIKYLKKHTSINPKDSAATNLLTQLLND